MTKLTDCRVQVKEIIRTCLSENLGLHVGIGISPGHSPAGASPLAREDSKQSSATASVSGRYVSAAWCKGPVLDMGDMPWKQNRVLSTAGQKEAAPVLIDEKSIFGLPSCPMMAFGRIYAPKTGLLQRFMGFPGS